MRLASLNLLHGRSLLDGLVDAARLADAARSLDADVIALQEVDRAQPRSHGLDLTELVAEAVGAVAARFEPTLLGTPGEEWAAAQGAGAGAGEAVPGGGGAAGQGTGAAVPGGGGGPAYGVGLVSRLPVVSWQVVRLPRAPVRSPVFVPGMGRRMTLLADEPRLGLVAVLDTPAGPLTVTSTHLSFVPGWNLVQLRRLTRRLGALAGPQVLLGDLNLPGPLPRLVSGWRSLATVPTYPGPAPRLQLDHALGHGDLPAVTAVAAVELAVSDHRALLVDLAES